MICSIIIIGAGPAGVIAAENLRKLDPESTITIIGDEKEVPYSRIGNPLFAAWQDRGKWYTLTHIR